MFMKTEPSVLQKIRVLIIDDSALMRRIIMDLISGDPKIEVVGSFACAKYALSMLDRLNPDVVTLDVEMPEMDGLTALAQIKKTHPNLRVIMCSSITEKGGAATLQALNLGADDYVTKPANGNSRDVIFQQLRHELIYKIKELAKPQNLSEIKTVPPVARPPGARVAPNQRIDILAIGISTGGPNALSTLLPKIAANFPVPIVIVQHMPPIFTDLLAKSLSEKSAIKIIEAHDGDELLPGRALIAPGNYHMTVDFVNNRHIVRLNQDPTENFCRPAVDVLFRSVAKQYGANTLALVMTGMGKDGQDGCSHIKEAKGQVIAQDETSCVVWGMPGAVVKAGLADGVYSLNELPQAIMQRVNHKRARL